jgi:single-strand DNA-binding protein
MNSVTLVGRVGKDPEMKYFETGTVKTTFNIAVSRFVNGSEIADWWKIELWDKQAESAGQYVKKGALVIVKGRFDIERWKDNEGSDREASVIKAFGWRFLGGKKKEEGQ